MLDQSWPHSSIPFKFLVSFGPSTLLRQFDSFIYLAVFIGACLTRVILYRSLLTRVQLMEMELGVLVCRLIWSPHTAEVKLDWLAFNVFWHFTSIG
jgi:hypothetical protein